MVAGLLDFSHLNNQPSSSAVDSYVTVINTVIATIKYC